MISIFPGYPTSLIRISRKGNFLLSSTLNNLLLLVFQWILSDSKSQVSRTLLSILADINNVFFYGSDSTSYSKSFTPSNNHMVTVPSAPIIFGIRVTFMLHSFFRSLARSRYLYILILLIIFQFYPLVSRNSIVNYSAASLFFCTSLRLLVWPRLSDPFVSQNPKEFCASHFLGRILGCFYTVCSYDLI